MTGPRWETVKRLFHEALDRPVDGRTGWLAQQCREDPEVGAEVERLIAAHLAAGSFIEAPVTNLHAQPPLPRGARVGTRLGPYRLEALLGAGGMGEVYRARDSTLHRDVAIKLLPEDVATDPERLARFEREAQALAALNHPNIAAVYAVDTSGDAPALVMELAAGEDLSTRIQRGPIPLVEVLPLARQIADALAAAHEAGIIHRDLKPANIKVKDDGTVKVLDFGLAKALKPPGHPNADALNSPTISADATSQGVILGTAAYMAPEQARGKAVDKRADIWAFGVVLYEMLTGQRLFAADEMSDTLVHVLTRDPDWTALPAATPASVRRLLMRCLAKDVKQRLHDIGDARLELEIDEAVGPAVEPHQTTMTSARALRRERLVWTTVLAAALLALASVAYFARESRPAVTRSYISVAPADRILASFQPEAEGGGRPSRTAMALSPNGRTIVFSAVRGNLQQLFRRDLDQLEAVPMDGTEAASSPFFSPDGMWVGFWGKGALSKVALSGGPVTKVCDVDSFWGASWGSNEIIAFARQRGGLWRVPSGGGTPTPLTALDPKAREVGHWLPHFLPDGKNVVFTVAKNYMPVWKDARLWVVALANGERQELRLGEGADARYASSGHLVFVRSGTLMAAPFDVTKQEVTGNPLTVLAGVMQAAYTPISGIETGAGQFSLSESGTLVYVPGGVFPDTDQPIVSVDRVGKATVLPGFPRRRYLAPRLSPDQSQLVVWSQGVDRIVWTYDISRGTLTQLTKGGRNSWAIWEPDGKWITFSGSEGGWDSIFRMPANGSGEPEPLITTGDVTVRHPSSWSGGTLAFIDANDGINFRVMTLSLDGDRRPAPFLPMDYRASTPEFSPDGRYLAYSHESSGRWEVYVRPYPGPGSEQHISNEGGRAPAWSSDRRELFYVMDIEGTDLIRIMAVPIVTMTPVPIFGEPKELFRGRYKQPSAIRNYEVTKDGQRFYLTLLPEDPPVELTQMILVQNFFEELKAKVPPGR